MDYIEEVNKVSGEPESELFGGFNNSVFNDSNTEAGLLHGITEYSGRKYNDSWTRKKIICKHNKI